MILIGFRPQVQDNEDERIKGKARLEAAEAEIVHLKRQLKENEVQRK